MSWTCCRRSTFRSQLQVRLALRFPGAQSAWRTGVVLSRGPTRRALVELSPDGRHVACVVRGETDNDRLPCLELLRELVGLATSTRDKSAAGVPLTTLTLGIDVDRAPKPVRVAASVAELEPMAPGDIAPGC